MGYGDEIMGAGMAKGLASQGKRAAFGDGNRIIWSDAAHEIFQDNPNVAPPGTEGAANLVWFEHYTGRRAYHSSPNRSGRAWCFDEGFRPTPGEFFFTDAEKAFAEDLPRDFVVIEPTVKPRAVNKQWGRWDALVKAIGPVVQFGAGPAIPGASLVRTPSFRHAAAAMQRARLAILPEGGLHHAAAAVGTRAVVIFGGFIHPRTTGYVGHVNLFIGDRPCGHLDECAHCRQAMASITVDQVIEAAREVGL